MEATAVETKERPMSIYRLMDDRTLERAVADLERRLEQLKFARGPVAPALTRSYVDALDRARAEIERRRT